MVVYLPAGCAVPLSVLTFVPDLSGIKSVLNTAHVSVHNYHRFCTDICMYVLYYVVT